MKTITLKSLAQKIKNLEDKIEKLSSKNYNSREIYNKFLDMSFIERANHLKLFKDLDDGDIEDFWVEFSVKNNIMTPDSVIDSWAIGASYTSPSVDLRIDLYLSQNVKKLSDTIRYIFVKGKRAKDVLETNSNNIEDCFENLNEIILHSLLHFSKENVDCYYWNEKTLVRKVRY